MPFRRWAGTHPLQPAGCPPARWLPCHALRARRCADVRARNKPPAALRVEGWSCAQPARRRDAPVEANCILAPMLAPCMPPCLRLLCLCSYILLSAHSISSSSSPAPAAAALDGLMPTPSCISWILRFTCVQGGHAKHASAPRWRSQTVGAACAASGGGQSMQAQRLCDLRCDLRCPPARACLCARRLAWTGCHTPQQPAATGGKWVRQAGAQAPSTALQRFP